MAICLASVFLVGCATPNKPYWITWKKSAASPQKPADIQPSDFHPRLSVVEFDEQGDLWSKTQLEAARKQISSSPKPPLLVVYIHGWQNDAHPKNRDLRTFNDFLNQLESTKAINRKFTVNGVFIGWRGASFIKETDWTIIGWVLRQSSFWSRKAATDRMAGVPLTGALAKLSASARNASAGRGVTIFIGHSFGGRILERALGQSIVSQAAFSESGKIDLMADLTVLINPAAESLYGRMMRLTTASQKRPAIVSITSSNDSATSLAWPIGVGGASIFGGFRDYSLGRLKPESQRSYVLKTAGHDPRMHTHKIEKIATELPQTTEPFGYNLAKATNGTLLIRNGEGGQQPYRISRLDKTKDGRRVSWMVPDGPYWVMQVPPEVLDNHGGLPISRGIFSDQVIDLLAGIFAMAKASDIEKTPTVTLQENMQSGEPIEKSRLLPERMDTRNNQ